MRYTIILLGSVLLSYVGMTTAKPANIKPQDKAWDKEVNGLAVSTPGATLGALATRAGGEAVSADN